MEKLVIYSCLTGKYDEIPNVPADDDIEYVLFTDLDEQSFPEGFNWQIRKIDNSLGYTQHLTNRYYKFNPHIIFPDYQYSLYIDANIAIKNTNGIKLRHKELIQQVTKISIPKHPWRNCIYEECLAITKLGRDDIERVTTNMKLMVNANYPVNNGFYENNFIWRSHNDKNVIEFMELVWSLLTKEGYSRRDQLVLIYAAWTLGVNIVPFWENGLSCRDEANQDVSCIPHNWQKHPKRITKLLNILKKLTIPSRYLK